MNDDAFVTKAQARAMVESAVAQVKLEITELGNVPPPLKIFGLDGSREYAENVANHIGISLTPHDEKLFPDGENYAKSASGRDGNVRGANVFVIQSLYGDDKETVSDKFMKLSIMCGSLRDASARNVIAVIPNLGWARQDRKVDSREPISTKYIAKMLQAVGVSRALFVDVHNLAAVQNAFDTPIDNLEAKKLFATHFAKKLINSKKIAILSPDAGGMLRAHQFRGALVKELKRIRNETVLDEIIEIAVYDKIRVKGVVKGGRIIGDIDGADVIAIDDMISTCSTMSKGCSVIPNHGGKLVGIAATHGLFCGDANKHVDAILKSNDCEIVLADTVDPWRLSEENKKRLTFVSTAEMMAEAIMRIHHGTGSISELLS